MEDELGRLRRQAQHAHDLEQRLQRGVFGLGEDKLSKIS